MFARSSKKLKQDWNCQSNQVRDEMNFNELCLIAEIERMSVRLLDSGDYEPLEAVDEAGERLLMKTITR